MTFSAFFADIQLAAPRSIQLLLDDQYAGSVSRPIALFQRTLKHKEVEEAEERIVEKCGLSILDDVA